MAGVAVGSLFCGAGVECGFLSRDALSLLGDLSKFA